jgi:predicted TIM-barrel fold metal-dependent hydrolase
MSLYTGSVIDAHHHLWDLSMGRHRWLMPAEDGVDALGDIARIQRNYLIEDYRRDAQSQNVAASVHVEAMWDRERDAIEETAWLETLDKSDNLAARYVAFVPLADPQAEAMIERQAAFKRVVGVRAMLSWHPIDPAKSFCPDPHLAESPAWRRGARALAKHGLHLELMLYPYQADQVVALAKAIPDLTIVLNHCASPVDQDAEGLARWRDGLKSMAAMPNIALKISALHAYAPDSETRRRDIARHCIDCFGPARGMFGSDFPVGRLWTSFDTIYAEFKELVRDLSHNEQVALFHDAANRFYRPGLKPLSP